VSAQFAVFLKDVANRLCQLLRNCCSPPSSARVAERLGQAARAAYKNVQALKTRMAALERCTTWTGHDYTFRGRTRKKAAFHAHQILGEGKDGG
jgi:hypothetical protein